MMFGVVLFFFFKQKTAYELRISDWSSDVCSSDLPPAGLLGGPADLPATARRHSRLVLDLLHEPAPAELGLRVRISRRDDDWPVDAGGLGSIQGAQEAADQRRQRPDARLRRLDVLRSEEHTSELQSLMRISYAVFCWKKK